MALQVRVQQLLPLLARIQLLLTDGAQRRGTDCFTLVGCCYAGWRCRLFGCLLIGTLVDGLGRFFRCLFNRRFGLFDGGRFFRWQANLGLGYLG